PARPARVEFQEAYLWDLAPDASTLSAYLRYQISRGAATALSVDLPGDLEVRAAQARRPAGADPADPPVRLADWSVQGVGGRRRLRLDLPGPVSGAVEVTLELVPRGPWAGTVLLPVPRPLGQPAAGALSYLAYRTRGLAAVRSSNFLRVTGIEAKDFAP